MRAYEAVLVLAPTLDEDGVTALIARATQAVEQNGGHVTSVDRWGKRRLAYDIQHHKEAWYVLLRLDAPTAGGTAELEHVCRISEDVLRHLVVQAVEGVPAAPGQPDKAPEVPRPAAPGPSAQPPAARPATT